MVGIYTWISYTKGCINCPTKKEKDTFSLCLNILERLNVERIEKLLDQYIHRVTECVSKSQARRIYFTNRNYIAQAIITDLTESKEWVWII